MGDEYPTAQPASSAEIAAYIAELTADLARLARGRRLDLLGYLLDMARLEARNCVGEGTSTVVSATPSSGERNKTVAVSLEPARKLKFQ